MSLDFDNILYMTDDEIEEYIRLDLTEDREESQNLETSKHDLEPENPNKPPRGSLDDPRFREKIFELTDKRNNMLKRIGAINCPKSWGKKSLWRQAEEELAREDAMNAEKREDRNQ